MAIASKKKPQHQPKTRRKPPQAPSRKAGGKPGGGTSSNATDRSAPALAEVDADVLEFIEAIDHFKKQHGRPFPSWSEVLLVLRQLGYTRR
jgi:hypothetical protein